MQVKCNALILARSLGWVFLGAHNARSTTGAERTVTGSHTALLRQQNKIRSTLLHEEGTAALCFSKTTAVTAPKEKVERFIFFLGKQWCTSRKESIKGDELQCLENFHNTTWELLT